MNPINYFFHCCLFLLACCSPGDNSEEIICAGNPQGKIQFELIPQVYRLHDVSEYYFISHLNTFTYHQGFYYNLDKNKSKIYQFRFSSRGADTTDIFLTRKMSLDSRPKEFCLGEKDLYVIFEYPKTRLLRYPAALGQTTAVYSSEAAEVISDNMLLMPNARLKINRGHYITGKFNLDAAGFQDKDDLLYDELDVSTRNIISKFGNVYESDPHDFLPAMEYPYRLDLDSLSFVSAGFKKTIDVFNNQTGIKKGSYCANSKYVFPLTGIVQNEDWDFQMQYDWLIGNAYYKELLFDERQKYFFRIAKHQQEVKNKSTLKINRIENAPWSLVVLDNSMNYVDEINIPAKTINFLKYFSDDGGIHFLSMDSISNSPSDSILQFKKLKVL